MGKDSLPKAKAYQGRVGKWSLHWGARFSQEAGRVYNKVYETGEKRGHMNVWWLTINRAMGNSYSGLKFRKVIAQGWPLIGDLTILCNHFDEYWRYHRSEFEQVIKLLTAPVYPADAGTTPKALLNFYNLLSIQTGDLIVAVESAHGAGPVMGICQADRNAWESYFQDDPETFDYAQCVCFPVEWIDWDESVGEPPHPPAMIAGIQPMGAEQAYRVMEMWNRLYPKYE